MRIRSEWITIALLTGLTAAVLIFPKRTPPVEVARAQAPAEGVDFMPVGSPVAKTRAHAARPHN